MGGTLNDEKRRDATNMTGTGITGGRSYALAKGGYVFIVDGLDRSLIERSLASFLRAGSSALSPAA